MQYIMTTCSTCAYHYAVLCNIMQCRCAKSCSAGLQVRNIMQCRTAGAQHHAAQAPHSDALASSSDLYQSTTRTYCSSRAFASSFCKSLRGTGAQHHAVHVCSIVRYRCTTSCSTCVQHRAIQVHNIMQYMCAASCNTGAQHHAVHVLLLLISWVKCRRATSCSAGAQYQQTKQRIFCTPLKPGSAYDHGHAYGSGRATPPHVSPR